MRLSSSNVLFYKYTLLNHLTSSSSHITLIKNNKLSLAIIFIIKKIKIHGYQNSSCAAVIKETSEIVLTFIKQCGYSKRTPCGLRRREAAKEKIRGSSNVLEWPLFSKSSKRSRGRVWFWSSNGWPHYSLHWTKLHRSCLSPQRLIVTHTLTSRSNPFKFLPFSSRQKKKRWSLSLSLESETELDVFWLMFFFLTFQWVVVKNIN